MKKLIAVAFISVLMLVMLPSVLDGMTKSFDVDCTQESQLSPLYNATVKSAKFLGTDGTSEYFLLKLHGNNVHVLENRKSNLRIFARTCDECGVFDIGTLEGGSQIVSADIFSISVNSADKTADNFADIGFKLPRQMVGGETTIKMEFHYCDNSAPFEGNDINLCGLFVDERSVCPSPELAEPPVPNPFLGAEAEIVIAPEMTITTGGAQFTTPDENHVIMDINITGSMMHLLVNEHLESAITVWRTYGNATVRLNTPVELIDKGNNVYTLRIRVLGQLKNRFAATSFRIEYEKPPQQPFEFNVQKMCTLITSDPNLPLFCTPLLQVAPVQIQMLVPPDE